MLVPVILARMKQLRDLAVLRVDPGKIRPFVQVAVPASQGQVGRAIPAAVLPGDDMLDVEPCERQVLLRDAAVLAAIPRVAPPNSESPDPSGLCVAFAGEQRPSLGLQDADEVDDANVRLILGAFIRG